MNSTFLKLIIGICLVSLSLNSIAVTVQSISLPLVFQHETNPRFSTSDQNSINRVTLTPQYSITSKNAANQWFSTARLSLVRTSDQSLSQDRNDPSLNVGWIHDYETGQFSVTGFLSEQSTRESEFTDSGIISGDNTKSTRTLSASWQNSLTERTSLTLGGNYTKASFQGIATGLVDYQNETSYAKLSYLLNEQTEAYTQISYTQYQPQGSTSLQAKTKSADVGITWTLNETTSTSISVGTNETISNNSTSQSWQASINTRYATLRTNSVLSLSRSQSPSSTGVFSESNQFRFGWTYNLSEIDNLMLDFSWRENLSFNNTITTQFSGNYTRELSLSWDFGLTVDQKSREDKLTNANSSSIMAKIIYKLPDY